MIDHTHFKTIDGLVFTTRGFFHPETSVRAVPVYKPSQDPIVLNKSLDEFGDIWLKKEHPSYVQQSIFGQGIFVPNQKIAKIYDPFQRTLEILSKIDDVWSQKIIQTLLDLGIEVNDLGFIGSNLVDTGRKPHDLDLIIRGKENLNQIRQNFHKILCLLGAKNSPNEEYISKSTRRYEEKFNSVHNDFGEMIQRRWPTINIPNKFFGKLRFTYLPEEVPSVRILGKFISEKLLCGEVTDDSGTNFMPRTFSIESQNNKYEALTYFWDYSYCVKKWDRVIIKGSLYDHNFILLNKPKKHGIRFKKNGS